MLTAIADLSSEQGIRPSALAKALGVAKPFVSTECAKLIRRGLVQKRPDPQDARGALLSITEKAFKELQRISPAVRRANDICFQSLSRTEFQRLCKMVDALVAHSAVALETLKKIEID